MFFENQYLDNQPLGRVGRMPIYLTTIVVAIIVVGLILSALSAGNVLALCYFDPELAWRHGQVWRVVTYLAVDEVNFFTIFNLLFLYGFGRDCEREMGRGRYSVFLGLLTLTPALVATLLWLFGIPGGVAGSIHLSMGLVIAFATIYPNIPWFAEIPMKFVAIGCMFLAAVGHLSHHDQIGLGATLATCAVSFGYIRALRAGVFSAFSWSDIFRRKPKLRLLPPLEQEQKSRKPSRGSGTSDEVDALLDKIAKSGLHSLTAKEKSRLQAAREELLKKDRK